MQTAAPAHSTGGITIESATSGGTVLDNVMHAFISHGPDGHGAFPGPGSATTLTSAQSVARRINAGSTDTDELTNAGVNSSFTSAFTNVKVMKGGTGTFGDVVYYAPYQKNTCCVGPYCHNYGFRADGVTAGRESGFGGIAIGDINGDEHSDLVPDRHRGEEV